MCACADPVCAGSLLGSRTSDVSERRAREQRRRQKAGGICCRGRDEQPSCSKNHRAWLVRAQAGPDGASVGPPGGVGGWVVVVVVVWAQLGGGLALVGLV